MVQSAIKIVASTDYEDGDRLWLTLSERGIIWENEIFREMGMPKDIVDYCLYNNQANIWNRKQFSRIPKNFFRKKFNDRMEF